MAQSAYRHDNESPATGRRDHYYLAFTADHDVEAAAARFIARFGQPPERIEDAPGGILLVGPVPSPLSMIGRGAGGEGARGEGQLSLRI